MVKVMVALFCKDCKYWETDEYGKWGDCTLTDWMGSEPNPWSIPMQTGSHDYCSFGERKSGGDE